MSGVDSFLLSELNVLATEAKKKHVNVKEAADKAIGTLRALKATASEKNVGVADEIAASEDVLQPLLLSFESKNARLVAISLNCLQKMILAKAVADASLPLVVKVLREASDGDAGQDIHLKVLQTLQPLLSNYPSITDALLAEVLLLCFRLYSAKLPVVSNTAAATVEQLVIHCFDKVAGELERGDAPNAAEPFPNVAAAVASLEPFAKDAFLLFQDICLLTNGDAAEWLKVGSIPRSFGLELVGAVLTNHHKTFVAHKAFHILLRDRVCPMVIKAFSDRSQFKKTVRLLRVMSVLITDLNAVVTMECEVFLLMLIKTIDGPADGPSAWTRILALEMLRRFSSDMDVITMVYRNYDKQNTTTLLEDMLKVCARVVETQLRVEAPSSPSSEQQLVLPYVKVPLLDQLDKTDTPTVPDNYAGALALAVALGIVEGMGAVVLPAFYQGTEQPARVNGVIAPDMPAAQRDVVNEIADVAGVAWSHLLQTLSAVLARTTSADETVNTSLFKAYQTFTTVAGVLGLEVPRDAFLTSLRKFCLPAQSPEEGGAGALTDKNFQALQTMMGIAHSLASVLGAGWQVVFDTLQQVDRAVNGLLPPAAASAPASNTAPGTPARMAAAVVRSVTTPRAGPPVAKRTGSNVESNSLHVFTSSARNLYESVQYLPEDAVESFMQSLCAVAMSSSARPAKAVVGESRSYGIDKISESSLHIVDRLLTGHARTWDIIMDALTALAASEDSAVRAQASEAVTEIVHAGIEQIEYKKLAATHETQERLLKPLLTAARIPYPEVQSQQLQMLYQLLQTGGHSLTHTWPLILESLRAVADKAATQRSSPHLESTLKYAFQSLQLICTDFVVELNVACLHQCIATLGNFMAQTVDINVSLTAVGLMWNLVDFTRSSRNRLAKEVDGDAPAAAAPTEIVAAEAMSAANIEGLWEALLAKLGHVSGAERPEVRNGAVQILFRAIVNNGALFAPSTWQATIWRVLVPVLTTVKQGGRGAAPATPATGIVMHHSRNTLEKQWDETRVLAMQGVARALGKHLALLLQVTPDDTARLWALVFDFIEEFAVSGSQEVAVAAVACLEELLSSCHRDASLRGAASLSSYWAAAWAAWERIGCKLAVAAPPPPPEVSLAFVRAFGAVRALHGGHFTPAHIRKLFSVLRGVLLLPLHELARDQESLTPLQAAALQLVDGVGAADAPLAEATAAELTTLVLDELAEYARLAFDHRGDGAAGKPTFIALSTKALARLTERFEAAAAAADVSVFSSGVFERVVAVCARPMTLRHECPAPKGARPTAAWKAATAQFLAVAKSGLVAIEAAGEAVPQRDIARAWDAVLGALRGALMPSQARAPVALTADELDEDDQFEIAVIERVRVELVPLLHRAPASVVAAVVALFRDGVDFGGDDDGVLSPTASAARAPPPREKLSCAFLCSLYQLASADASDAVPADSPKAAVIASLAALAADAVMAHGTRVLADYARLKGQSGAMPLPRLRQEEVTLVLQEALKLKLHPRALVDDARVAALPFANRHLFGLYPHMVRCIGVADRPVLALLQSALARVGSEMGLEAPS